LENKISVLSVEDKERFNTSPLIKTLLELSACRLRIGDYDQIYTNMCIPLSLKFAELNMSEQRRKRD
jgi:hypothetical protein